MLSLSIWLHNMKIFKHIETGHVVEEANPNHYSIYSRFGYEEIKEKPVEKIKKTKKVNK